MKKLLALTAAAAAVAIPAFAATTKTDKVTDSGFSPKSITIKKGDSIHWVWTGKKKHQVFQVGGPGHFHYPKTAKVKAQFTHRFTTKGTYKFVDPYGNGAQYVTIIVK